MISIKDKVIVITGASSGIGAAAAKQVAELGAIVVVTTRREERLKELVDSFPDGTKASYVKADVTDKDDVQAVIDHAVEKYGRVDVLFNNAGIMPQGPLADARHEEWKQTIDINVTGVLNGIAAALPVMKEQGDGHIVVTSSEAGFLHLLVERFILVRNRQCVRLWKLYVKKKETIISAQRLLVQVPFILNCTIRLVILLVVSGHWRFKKILV